MKIDFPYGRGHQSLDIPDARLKAVLVSKLHSYRPEQDQTRLVRQAMENPIGSLPLWELARGKEKVVIIASDHTRPVPSKFLIPPMLEAIRRGNPNADITILISTGCHRQTTREELRAKFGDGIFESEKILVHDCDDSPTVKIGTLPSGGECYVNKIIMDADLLVSEGFIEPHFFAGFSGGRKSVLPGVASRTTVLANHCSEFIAHPNSRTGIVEGNPIHADMVWAARKAKLAFILNVVLNGEKEIIHAVAGDLEQAHRAGCDFLLSLCRAEAVPADIVISTNGGYPLDQNIYQAVKGMTAAEATVKEGGVIIMVAKSADGHGGEDFYRQMADEPDIQKTLDIFLARGRNETVPDQWQTQIFIRVLQKARIIYVSDAPEETVRGLHLIPAKDLRAAMALAEEMMGENATVTAIPDGVGVMVV